jgi:thymidylate synthase (FAD)
MRNQHTSPFEQVILTFHVKLPIFVARQWVRHRTARLNEISGRYSVLKEEFYLPDPSSIRFQSKRNKQGRDVGEVTSDLKDKVIGGMNRDQELLYAHYNELIEANIARELARINLPLSLYTEWYWQIDLHNLFHFLRLRMDSHAQYEIREYANVLGMMAKRVAPIAYEAFEEHVLFGARLSMREVEAIRRIIQGESHGLSEKEIAQLEQKLGLKGLSGPG